MVVSSYMCQPNHSYAESMFRLHSDHIRGCVIADVLHGVWVKLYTPPRDYPTVLFIGLWPRSFTKSCSYILGFVWYLLRAVTPSLLYFKSAIL